MAETVLADIDLTPTELRRRLEAWFAQRLGYATSICDLAPLSGGLSNVTYRAIVVLGGPKGSKKSSFALRWESITGPSAPYDVAFQYRVFEALQDTAVPVPRTYWLERDPSVIGQPFWVLELVEAENVGRLLDISDPRSSVRLDAFVDALAKIHEIDWRKSGMEEFCPIHSGNTIPDLIARQKLHRVELAEPGDVELFDRARQWLYANIPQTALSLNHGDCSLSNYMYRGQEVVAVIDWEFASLADPMMDVGYYCALLFRFRTNALAEREEERADFLERYMRRTGLGGKTLRYWEIFANFRNSLSWTKHGHAHHLSNGYAAYRDRLRSLLVNTG